jgi:hypothetical protein
VQEAEDGVDDRGLTGPVGPEQSDRLTGRDLEAQAVDGQDVPVADGEPGDGVRDTA